MATFLIETYLPRGRPAALAAATRNLRAAAEPPVHFVRSFFVPEDEMAFFVVEAPSIALTMELSRRAGLLPERIVETEGAAG